MSKLTFDKKSSNQIRPTSDEPNSPERRQFLGMAGTTVGFVMLGGLSACGGGASSSPVVSGDPIWGNTGLATKIINSLQNITQNAFKNVDYDVVAYGAAQCAVVAAANPYAATLAAAAASPVSPGADKTQAPNAFDSRPAFLAAISACNAAGGGRVVVPSGDWYCAGPIVLLSNVNFHLSADCTIYFSPDPTDYAKDGPVDCGTNGKLYNSRWQADDCLNFGAPIYAYQQTNIAITGADPKTSILNGQAMTPFSSLAVATATGTALTTPYACWWSFKGTKNAYGTNAGGTTASQAVNNLLNLDLKTVLPGIDLTLYGLLTSGTPPWQQDQNYLPALSEAGIPVSATLKQRVFGLGHFLRPCMVEFIGCTNVLMENYQINNSPFWLHHPVHCTNVVIRSVYVNSIGPNNDGFDPEACNTVLCDGMTFNTGDDCIAIKSGKNLDTQYGPAIDHVVQNCTMNSGHGGITLGSEMSAGVQNIYARKLTMLNANWATNPLNIAIRIKTNMNRGGSVKNFYVDDVTLPNGVNTVFNSSAGTVGSPKVISGSPINTSVPAGVVVAGGSAYPSNNQGGIITFDCDYTPTGDAIRVRPPKVENINISNVQASNVTIGGVTASCFQAIVAQGPVVADYNGPAPTPTMYPITGVTISNCNFGTAVCAGPASPTVAGPVYAFNVNSITLKNVTIAGTAYNTVITDAR